VKLQGLARHFIYLEVGQALYIESLGKVGRTDGRAMSQGWEQGQALGAKSANDYRPPRWCRRVLAEGARGLVTTWRRRVLSEIRLTGPRRIQ